MTVRFELFGEECIALDGGPEYRPTPAVSLMVYCEDQAEVDRSWDALLAGGGEEVACGWITDRYGCSWQIVPRRLMELVTDPDHERQQRAMAAMLQQKRIILSEIEDAARGAVPA